MAQTAPATDTAALVAFLRALETGSDPADAARGERLIDWLVHAVDHPDDALDGGMLLRVHGPPASGKDILARLVQALLPTNRCFIDRQVEQLHRTEPLPPHPVRRTFCEVNVNVTGGATFGVCSRVLYSARFTVWVYAEATRHWHVRLPTPAVGGINLAGQPWPGQELAMHWGW